MEEERDLSKLGTVLAVQNGVVKDALDMLREQQKRQVRMIWASLAIVAMAVLVVGLSMYCTLTSFDKLTDQVQRNTILSTHNAEVIQHAHAQEKGQEPSN